MTSWKHTKLSLALLALILVPTTGFGQSLGEIARQCRKEREARERKGEIPVKVFTNDDIARMPPIASLKSSVQAPPSTETKSSASAQPPGAAVSETQAGAPAASAGKPENLKKSKDFWRARFKAARARLAHAREEQTLVEDELHLLQVQQARELNPDRSRKMNGRIDTTTVELEAKRAATEKAQQALEKLKEEFKESGAPQVWIEQGTTAGP